MTQRFLLLSLLCLLPVVLSCATGQGVPAATQPAPDYYPLQVGNTWYYQSTVDGKEEKVIGKIARTEKVNGKNMAVLELSADEKMVGNEYLYREAGGVFRARVNDRETTPPLCLLKLPLKDNATWGGEFSAGEDKGKYTAEAVEESVEVPAGKFKAIRVLIKVEIGTRKIENTYWFAADVGVVKHTTQLPDLKMNVELEKFARAK